MIERTVSYRLIPVGDNSVTQLLNSIVSQLQRPHWWDAKSKGPADSPFVAYDRYRVSTLSYDTTLIHFINGYILTVNGLDWARKSLAGWLLNQDTSIEDLQELLIQITRAKNYAVGSRLN